MAFCSVRTSERSTSIPQESACSAGLTPMMFWTGHRGSVSCRAPRGRQERDERSLAGERGLQADATVVGLDGAARDVEVRTTVLGDPAVSVALIVALIVSDVTERRRAELALRESEERLRHAFAGAQEGVWDWNLETGAVVYSERWKQMLGYGDDEIEPHVRAWERLLHPGDRATAEALTDSVLRR